MAITISGTNGITFPSTYTQADVAIGGSSSAQIWTDVTSSRAVGTTYTNSTGRGINVMIAFSSPTTTVVTVQSVVIYPSAASSPTFVSFVVPNGATYALTTQTNGFNKWCELR